MLAVITKDGFRLVSLVNDQHVPTFKQLQWNQHAEFLVAYELNRKAMVPNYS